MLGFLVKYQCFAERNCLAIENSYLTFGLFLNSESEVTGITKSRHYVTVSIYFRIHGTEPNSSFIFRESLFDVIHGLLRCYHGAHMDMCRITFSDKCPVTQFHRGTGGKHRVCNHQCFAVKAR